MEVTTITSFLDYYAKVRQRTQALVRIIPHDQLEWAYLPGKFTVGDQVRHIASIERYMFAETIAGRQSAYKGCGKDLAEGYENVIKFFNDLHDQSIAFFKSLRDEDLERKCTTPGHTKITIGKWLLAMIEHEVHHRGQLYLYLNMLGVKTPPMFGLTAEELARRSI